MDDVLSMPGHNRPPPDLLTGEELRAKLVEAHAALAARRDELLAAGNRVPDIDSEDVARKVSDFIGQIAAASKAADGARVAEKEPYLSGGRVVDGFFKGITDPLETLKKNVERKLRDYLREKEAAERREREREAREARERELEARRKAEEAAQAARDQATLDAAIAQEKAAEAAAADAEKAQQAAEVKPAELSRTRGEFGAVASLRTFWTFKDLNREALDLEALRHHLPTEGLAQAIRSFIKAGGRELKGVEIYEDSQAVVR